MRIARATPLVTRRGLLGRVHLAPWEAGIVLPHEQTFDGPRRERLQRLRAVKANLSPLYLLYLDPVGELESLLETLTAGQRSTFHGVDPTGATHRLFTLSDPPLQRTIQEFFAKRRLYMADGHHRYEAALAYRDERRAAAETGDPDAPWDFVLVLLAAISDPGARVLPTHRLITGVAPFDAVQVRHDLTQLFDLVPMRESDSPSIDSRRGTSIPPVCHVLFSDDPRPWTLSTRPDQSHRVVMSSGHGPRWEQFAAAIVDDAVVRYTLGISAGRSGRHVTYTHDAAVARAAVSTGGAQLSLLLPTPSLEDLIAIADAGDRLPPKSTYFDPKAAAGLIINDVSSKWSRDRPIDHD